MRETKNIKNCKQYQEALEKENSNFIFLFPLNRYKNSLIYSKRLCPNCSSDVITEGKFFGFRQIAKITPIFLYNKKEYCLNDDCVYHYFEIKHDSVEFHGNSKEIVKFVKNEIRKDKFKNIL